MKRKKIVKIIFKNEFINDDYNVLRNYMTIILPNSFDPQKSTNLKIEGGINLIGDFTTFIGYLNTCSIVKPTIKDYLELANALKYKHEYKRRNS